MTGVFAYLVGGIVFNVVLFCGMKKEFDSSQVTWSDAILLLLLWPAVAIITLQLYARRED